MIDTIRYFLWRVWLWATKNQREDRFNKLVDWHSQDPFKYGVLPSNPEKEYEYPKLDIGQSEDVIEFFLQNSKRQLLFARISRLGNGYASMSFLVRLGDKGSWKAESVVVDRSTSDSFVAGGLRIESTLPMRRYRISFNGVVHNAKNEATHLRAIFVGNHITACGDYRVFHDNAFLAKQLPFSAKLESLEKLDIYVQTFSLTGKIYVEELEDEVYLWGYRRRQRLGRDTGDVELKARITAYTENGLGLDLNEASVKHLSPTLLFGHLNYPAFQQRPVQNFSADSIIGAQHFRIGAAQFKNLRFVVKDTLDEISWIEPLGTEWLRFRAKIVGVDYDGNVGNALITIANE
ncbi:uncharacterized protein LOC108863680 [Galendromus occidentalis]|uniref:Uncharacterized protein LOC108863680 n=1 Tax=Galendromus occidentalis TaxID=34638 RepID=A0AAJ7SD75_9ACAR|nr:uncharacterized protein LOC108863680 [Galendromus occidentalis]